MLVTAGFQERLQECATAVQARFASYFADLPAGPVTDGMAYATNGGKRLRAFLVMESAQLFGVADAVSSHAAAAIEAMHAYSLVHDDLPAMDDDDLRRGQPTVHVRWDEATAILVGDALQAAAFEMLAVPEFDLPDGPRLVLVRGLARAAGSRGMVRGQALDIAAETADAPYGISLIEETQVLKTGALFEWSATAGPVMAGADSGPLTHYARAFGRAFQIADDILDVEGDADLTGKRVGKDAARGKATFVTAFGLEPARTLAAELLDEACDALAPYGAAAENLKTAARFVIARQA